MRKFYWKTGGVTARRANVSWPSLGQVARQLAIAAVILLVWGAAFWGFLQLTDSPRAALAEATPAAVAAAEPTATDTAAPPPTPTPSQMPPTPTHTSTPAATATAPVATEPLAEDTVVTAEPSPLPTATSTETPSPAPTATDTPAPAPTPTETPPPLPVDAGPTDGGTVPSFSQDVLPIFRDRCFKCHGGEKTEEGLALTDYQDVLAGSWNGKVIVPGSVPDSFLIEQIVSGEMPKKEPRLLPAQIRIITAWIEAGAPNN